MPTKTIAQLTARAAPALTDLFEVDDGIGGSWQETAAQLLALALPPVLTVTYTGVLPATFPLINILPSIGMARITASGANAVMPIAGVCSDNFLKFSDSAGLLTTLEFNNLGALVQSAANVNGLNNDVFTPSVMANLTSLSAPILFYVAGNFNPNAMASLTTLSFPALAYVAGNFNPNAMTSLTTLSFPALAYVGGTFDPNLMASLTTLSFPALAYVGSVFGLGSTASLTTVSFPALAYVGSAFGLSSMASLTTLSLPAMITYGSTITANSGLGALANVTLGTIGTLKTIAGATINIFGQALTSASVNGLLALLVSLDGTGGTTLWGSGKTLNIFGGTSAAPSGSGITDKATLIARGATVMTN